MKRAIILIAILQKTFTVSAQFIAEKSPIVISVGDSIITHCLHAGVVCGNFSVKRDYKGQTLILLFPQGGASSHVTLYLKKDYYKYKDDQKEMDWKGKVRDEKIIIDGQPLSLNLTNEDDGKYVVIYSSCAFGGIIELDLMTNKLNK